MTDERWKPIAGFEKYEVSDLGRVRNLGGQLAACGKPGGFRVVPARILKPFIVKSTGYMQVLLPDRRKHSVHRLVAEAFCSGREAGYVVDHVNNVRHDNRAVNLRWLSHTENITRPYREGHIVSAMLGRTGGLANGSRAIVATSPTGETLRFDSAIDAVRKYGLDSGSISRCCQGKRSHHRGWKFVYLEHASLGREWAAAMEAATC